MLLTFLSLASAAPPDNWLEEVQASWENTRNYCGKTILATAAESGVVMTTGKRCLERGRGLLTEIDTPLGTAVEIRTRTDFWQYDPATPLVFHLVLPEGSSLEKPFGEELGEWVRMMSERAEELVVIDDLEIHGKAHWRVVLPEATEGREAVWMIDPELKLPVAMELREATRVLMSVGYGALQTNLELPDAYFQIRPLLHTSTVEVEWDPALDPQGVVQMALEEVQRLAVEELGFSPAPAE